MVYHKQSYFIQIRLAASKLTLVGHCVGSCKITFHSLHQSRHHQLKLPLRLTQYNVVQITLLHAVTICISLWTHLMTSCLHTTVASSLLHQLYMSDTVLQTPLPRSPLCPHFLSVHQQEKDLQICAQSVRCMMFPWQIIHCTCYWASEILSQISTGEVALCWLAA